MVKRHLCEYFEAGEECTNDLCVHIEEDRSQYLFDNAAQQVLFRVIYHLDGEKANDICAAIFLLLDAGFDEHANLDD